jgi:hypothetical protein
MFIYKNSSSAWFGPVHAEAGTRTARKMEMSPPCMVEAGIILEVSPSVYNMGT